MVPLPKDYVYRIKKPCARGHEGKWCRVSYWRYPGGATGVSFFAFDTEEQAAAGMTEKNAGGTRTA